MFMVLLALGSAALGGGIVHYWKEREDDDKLPHTSSEDPTNERFRVRRPLEYRIAVHEAGHAIAAWHSPYVTRINLISIDTSAGLGAGVCQYMTRDVAKRPPAHLWCSLALEYGGIAGELYEFGRCRSGSAERDLQRALDTTREIVALGVPDPPWTGDRPEVGKLGPSRMHGHVSPMEAHVMNIGFARAKALIHRDRERFFKISRVLLDSGPIDEKGVGEIFGARPLHF